MPKNSQSDIVLCANGQTLRTIEGSTSCVDAVAITPDGRVDFCANYTGWKPTGVRIIFSAALD